MLCRRCGMDSATTDVCEWCKKPMLPAGAAVTGQKAAAPAEATAAQAPPAPVAPAVEAAAAPGSDELVSLGPPPAAEQADARAQAAPDVLSPLGGHLGKPAPSAPSHGLAAEATSTSVDVANYLGPDQSLFRPMSRVEHSATSKGMDPLSQTRSHRQEKPVSDIPDNVRLMRSLVSGIAVAFPLAIAQYAITHRVPEKLFVVPLIRGGDSFIAAIVWGVASGVFLGFGLGALLVQFKKGPFVGLVFGLVLGFFGLATDPVYWGVIAAAVTGMMVGRHATAGYRRVIQV